MEKGGFQNRSCRYQLYYQFPQSARKQSQVRSRSPGRRFERNLKKSQRLQMTKYHNSRRSVIFGVINLSKPRSCAKDGNTIKKSLSSIERLRNCSISKKT